MLVVYSLKDAVVTLPLIAFVKEVFVASCDCVNEFKSEKSTDTVKDAV
jgi:hypothetical protein